MNAPSGRVDGKGIMVRVFRDGAGRMHVIVFGVTLRRAYFADDVRYLAYLARTRNGSALVTTVRGR